MSPVELRKHVVTSLSDTMDKYQVALAKLKEQQAVDERALYDSQDRDSLSNAYYRQIEDMERKENLPGVR
jgi:uncharacterized membrane protein